MKKITTSHSQGNNSKSKVKTTRYDSRLGRMDAGNQEFNYQEIVDKLHKYYLIVKKHILSHQSPTLGLFAADLASEERHIGHIRDSLWAANSVWALHQAYKRIDDDRGRTYELGQCTVKCMRGVLYCWMQQSEKPEKFKNVQSPKNALHCKFDLVTGETLTRDDEYEHLQLDIVALFLLFMVEMITSGLQIIYTTDEVNFIQNLVFYVERAYRTPDFGMWERGSKYNNGSNELHASSIGMAKAALEAINGFNLFGEQGAAWSVIYVDIDAHNRNRTIFDTLLPRESASKHTDASLIPTISWPCFSIHEEALKHQTLDKAHRKLKGKYGYKRFLRDGYKTVHEDKNRKYYRPAEIKMFDCIECEWPLFIIYLIIDSVYKNDVEMVEEYSNDLESLLKYTSEGIFVPKYYYVTKDKVDQERAQPGSQQRVASMEGEDGEFFLWGQAVYIISQLLVDGLLHINELDPIKRYLPAAERPKRNTRYSSFQSSPTDLVIQVVLIAESTRLQQMLATYGIQTQTPHQVEPIEIWSPNNMTKAYEYLGVNKKLGLTGRPARPIGGLGTAKIYRASGMTIVCYPLLFEVSDFYLSQDIALVIDDVKNDLAFLAKCWRLSGRPLFVMLIREDNIRGPNVKQLLNLLAQFKMGEVDGVKVRLGRLQELISSGCVEHLDFLSHSWQPEMEYEFQRFLELDRKSSFRSLTDIPKISMIEIEDKPHIDLNELRRKSTWELAEMVRHTDSVSSQSQLLHVLLDREGPEYRIDDSVVEERLEKLLRRAGSHQQWYVTRFCAATLGKLVDSLAPSITAILVRGKQITLGVFGHEEEVVDKPLSPQEIQDILFTKCLPYDIIQAVLQQEMILNIGKFISTSPDLFKGMLKIRIGWIIHAMKLELNYWEEGGERMLYSKSPHTIKKLLMKVLQCNIEDIDQRSPIWRRQLDGALNRVPPGFYDKVWEILERTPGGLKVAGYHLPQQPTLSDMTMYELNFSLLVEQMLSKIIEPAYRQLMVEAFMVVSTILERNPELEFQRPVNMDVLIKEAFQYFKNDSQPTVEEKEKQDKQENNMASFFNTPSVGRLGTTSYIAKAVVNHLLQGDVRHTYGESCSIS